MPASLKDRLEADQPSGSGQKYYNNYRGRGTFTKHNRGRSTSFKHRPFKSTVKEEPEESTVSLLSRIESSPSLLLRLSPERKKTGRSLEEEEEDVKEEEEDVKGEAVDLQSGRSLLAEVPVQVAETTRPKAYTRPSNQHDLTTNSPEPVSVMSASDAATERLAEELIASALEQGKRLFADASRNLGVPVLDERRSPASEAAVDDMLGIGEEASDSPLPRSVHLPPERATPIPQPKPLSPPASPSSFVVEQAKSILLPLIMQNVRARDPTADIEKIKERALSLLTDTECAELMQLASRMRSQQLGMQTTTRGGDKMEIALKVPEKSRSHSPMDMASKPLGGKSREDSTREIRSPTNKNPPLSTLSGTPGASTSAQPKRQVNIASTYGRGSPPTSSRQKSPPKAPRAMLEASLRTGTSPISPSAQGNYFTAGSSNFKSGPFVSRTPQTSQDTLAGAQDKITRATIPQTTASLPHRSIELVSVPSSPSKPVPTPNPASEADVDMELSSDDGDDSQSQVSKIQDGLTNGATTEPRMAGTENQTEEAEAMARTWPEIDNALAAKAKADERVDGERRGSDRPSVLSTTPQPQNRRDGPSQSDEETDIGSSPPEPAPQSSTTEVLPEFALDAPAPNRPADADTISQAPTEAFAVDSQDSFLPASDNTPVEDVATTVDDVRPEDTAADDIPPGLSSGDSRKRKLDEVSSPPMKRRALSRDVDHEPRSEKALPDEQNMLVEESGGRRSKEPETNNAGTQEQSATDEQMDQGSGDASQALVTEQLTDGPIVAEVSETRNSETEAAPPADGVEKGPTEDEQETAMDVDKPEEARVERVSAPPESPTVPHDKLDLPTDPSGPVSGNQESNTSDMQIEPQVTSSTEPKADTEQASAPRSSGPQLTVSMPKLYFAQVGASDINTHNLTFIVDEETAAAAQRWAERKKHFDPSQSHVRFSLLCLPCAAAQAASDRLDSSATPDDITNALWGVTTKWPKCGFLLVILNPDDVAYRGVLLPEDLDPSVGTGPIDVSARIKPGENVVQLLVLSNQSDCLYVLHAGVPSQEELNEQLDVSRWTRLRNQHV